MKKQLFSLLRNGACVYALFLFPSLLFSQIPDSLGSGFIENQGQLRYVDDTNTDDILCYGGGGE